VVGLSKKDWNVLGSVVYRKGFVGNLRGAHDVAAGLAGLCRIVIVVVAAAIGGGIGSHWVVVRD